MVVDSKFKYLQSTKFLVPIKNIILIFIVPCEILPTVDTHSFYPGSSSSFCIHVCPSSQDFNTCASMSACGYIIHICALTVTYIQFSSSAMEEYSFIRCKICLICAHFHHFRFASKAPLLGCIHVVQTDCVYFKLLICVCCI